MPPLPAAPEAVIALDDDKTGPVAGPVRSGTRLLVVEDSRADFDLVADCFEGLEGGRRFSLTHVSRLAAALTELAAHSADCVLLDLALPDAKGLEGVHDMLRSSPDVPVVVLTGLDDTAVAEAAVRGGAQDYLVKSELNGATLRRAVLYAIERHGQQAALRQATTESLEAQARFRQGFDSAPIGMALVALDGRFMEVNPSLCEMANCQRAQLLPLGIRDVLHPHDVAAFDLAFGQLQRGEAVSFRTEYRLVGPADRSIWALVAAAMVDSADGHPAYAIVQLEDISARKDAEARLVHQTLHDPLTGLPNRLLLQDRLNHALAGLDRRHESVGVFYLDLDGFKSVNDSFGHENGDALLVDVAGRLRRVVRPSDTVARVGGDEFVVLAEGLSGRTEAAEIADRMLTAMTTSVRLGDADVLPSVSIGVALATERHRTPELLLSEADAAMYRAKERGKCRFEIFDAERMALPHLVTEALIRSALALDDVIVAYQPIVDLATGNLVGLEALMRIKDAEHGLLQPKDFISTAEATGLIIPMGRRVLTQAVEEVARRLRRGRGEPFGVNVNLSARQLWLPGLADDIAMILATNSVAAQHLCLELTESVLIEGSPSVLKGMQQLKALGVKVGIDDFGTGYSSLTYLRRFPVDFVKIDTTFVAGLPDSANDVSIVKAVIGLAHALGLTTIAEGIETEAQYDMLRSLGCDMAQGFLLGTPQVPSGGRDEAPGLYFG